MKDLSTIETQLSRILGFFPRVETRIATVFAIDMALLVVSALNLGPGDLKLWYVTVPAVFTLLAVLLSSLFLYQANFPKVEGGEGSLTYFAAIRKRTEANYIREYLACDEEQYRLDLLGQVWRNSEILCDKYVKVKHATITTAVALVPFIIFVAATAIEHGRIPIFKS